MKSGRIIIGTLSGVVCGVGILFSTIVLNQIVFYAQENDISRRVFCIIALLFSIVCIKNLCMEDFEYLRYKKVRLTHSIISNNNNNSIKSVQDTHLY